MRPLAFGLAFIALSTVFLAPQTATAEPAEEAISVEFRGHGDKLTRPARRTLSGIADQLRAQPGLHVHFTVCAVAGPDPLASSTARADAIFNFLRRRGIAAKRIHAFGVREVACGASVRWSHAVRATPPRQLGYAVANR